MDDPAVGDPGEGPSTLTSSGDLREMIRSVIREDPTLLSTTGGHAPSSSGSGKLLGFLVKRMIWLINGESLKRVKAQPG